jgi:hypothetical protein
VTLDDQAEDNDRFLTPILVRERFLRNAIDLLADAVCEGLGGGRISIGTSSGCRRAGSSGVDSAPTGSSGANTRSASSRTTTIATTMMAIPITRWNVDHWWSGFTGTSTDS